MQNSEGFLAGLRTYLMGGGIVAHQVLKHFGYDVPDSLISESIDAILGVGAIVFRWIAKIAEKKKIEEALYTPVPATK